MTTIPTQCQPIADEIGAMEAERRDLQEELQQAPTGEKALLVQQIKALNRRIAAAYVRLTDCLASFPPPDPPPPPLDATFSGTATITTTNTFAPGPYTRPVTLTLVFDGHRTFVGITTFPAITSDPFDIRPFGRNVTTVTKTQGGSGSFNAGAILLPLTLRFDQSIDLPLWDEDSDLTLTLSTAPPGSPVAADGSVTLTGSGTFSGGFLGGSIGMVTLTGVIAPVP
jgi:hypothetical protein